MEQLVKILEDVPKVKLVGREIGPFQEGENADVKPWEASVLAEKGLAELEQDFSPVGLRKRLMKEEKTSQLGDLPPSFYLSVSCEVDRLRRMGDVERAEEIEGIVDSLLRLRVQKLSRRAISSDMPRSLPPEEVFLVNRLSRAMKIWRQSMDRLFEKAHKEEVGAHKRGIRRSIRGIVRDAADIQE